MPDLVYLYVAYTVVWAGVFLYLFWLHLAQRRLTREIDALREVVSDDSGEGG